MITVALPGRLLGGEMSLEKEEQSIHGNAFTFTKLSVKGQVDVSLKRSSQAFDKKFDCCFFLERLRMTSRCHF